ncbi:uncharacterized protein K441DRAFT_215889 [Cenococcum geophilum 1.58]|uniref:uncharacterized protein n=1 Tax=Cenococcum geophilum 1.58 TaxID=794803 RepID=UPI00358FE57D|nr:hypothetical protein K441DRAFT_215889 [Cenococcum geophilum 1.58]
MNNENDIMEHALEEIDEVGGPALNSVQPSARLRPMPVTDDGLYEEMTHKDVLKSRLVELTNSAKDCNASLYSKRSVSHSRRGKSPLAEFKAPMPAVLRTRSLSLGGNKDHRASFESKLARRSLLVDLSGHWSILLLTVHGMWTRTTHGQTICLPLISVSLPQPILVTLPSLVHQVFAFQDRLMAPNRIMESDESAVSPIMGESASSGDSFKHTRKASKHGILGSISHRIGIHSGPSDATGYAIGPDSLRNDDRSVGPGDRYPTTGLTPSALNLEEVRSPFSDDSSRSQRGGSFRKRLTHLKAKLLPVARSHSALENRCLQNGDESSKDLRFVIRPGGSMHTYDGTVGMSRMEFTARKVAEKIKTPWFRSGAASEHEWTSKAISGGA